MSWLYNFNFSRKIVIFQTMLENPAGIVFNPTTTKKLYDWVKNGKNTQNKKPTFPLEVIENYTTKITHNSIYILPWSATTIDVLD